MSKSKTQTVGQHFGKKDLDRIGFFDEPNPSPFDAYHGKDDLTQPVVKGRQMLAGPGAPFFERKFQRIFEGEALTEAWRKQAQDRVKSEGNKVSGTLKPPDGSKKHSSPGDSYGCFEKPTHFSPVLKDGEILGRQKGQREPPNMKTKPNPLGGPGYANICLNPFPTYASEPYEPQRGKHAQSPKFLSASAMMDFFPPNPYKIKGIGPTYIKPAEPPSKMIPPGRLYVPFPKTPGGNHDGCFNKFPAHSSDPYIKGREKPRSVKPLVSGGPTFRSKYTNSIVEQVTRRSCNGINYLNYETRVYPMYSQSI